MSNSKHIIVYSHGFGVLKDDRGLLSGEHGIAEAFPDFEHILFNYSDIDEENKIMHVKPFSVQTQRLLDAVSQARENNPEAIIDVIAHSQGTMVAALAKPQGIRKTILLAPVFDLNIERTFDRFKNDPNAIMDINSVSTLPPSVDGYTRLVPAKYWEERQNIDIFKEYNELAKTTEVIVIKANQDQFIPNTDLSQLDPSVKVMALDGDHGFHDAARETLLAKLKELLS